MNRILSAVQPTGNLHLGNYLGAIKNWILLQNDHEGFFCIVDLHALTIPQDPVKIEDYIIKTAAVYLASGIDTNKSTIFVQSSVSEHSELSWLLSCHTPLGWLNRMTQFKEKSKDNHNLCLGLYSYPILMAADILLYRANYVPVGEDQKQHIELSKKIADTFNKKYKTDFFPIPNPKITGAGTRIMSLKDASKKMSKSEISDLSRINILDTNDQIVKKIRKAKTNSSLFPNNIGGVTQSTEVNNLTNIYSSLTNLKRQEIFNTYCNRLFSTFKKDLTEIIINSVSPIRRRTNEFLQDKDEVRNILRKGSVKAQQIAGSNLLEIQKIIGIRSKNINYVKKNIF